MKVRSLAFLFFLMGFILPMLPTLAGALPAIAGTQSSLSTEWSSAAGHARVEPVVRNAARTRTEKSFSSADSGRSQACYPEMCPTGTIATIGVGSSPYGIAVNTNTNRIYVLNGGSNTVSVIDGATHSVMATVGVGYRPFWQVAVNPATNQVYVPNNGSGTVSVIDGETNTVVATITGLATCPEGVGVHPGWNRVYVTHAGWKLSIIDGSTNQIVGVINTGYYNHLVTVNTNSDRAYVSMHEPNMVAVVDLAASQKIADEHVGDHPWGVAVDSVTDRVYVANCDSNTVSVIDGGTNSVVATIGVGARPRDVAVNPFRNRAYVTNSGDNTLSIIDCATYSVVGTVDVGNEPDGVAVNPVTGLVYVANGDDNTVSVIWDGRLEIEINQGLGHQLDGAQKYVAGKDTAPRIFLGSPVVVNRSAQSVVIKRNGTTLTTLYPSEAPGQIVDELTFLCPSRQACGGWQAGSYTFDATVNGATASTHADFRNRAGLRILAVKVKVTDRGLVKHLPDDQWQTAGQFLETVYPLAFDGLDWWTYSELDATAYDLTESGVCIPGLWEPGPYKLWRDLTKLQPPRCGTPGQVPCFDKIVGFIPPMPICGTDPCIGEGCTRGWTYGAPANIVMANGDYINDEGETVTVASMQQAVAHEIGHTAPYLLGDEYDQFNGAFQCQINPPPARYFGRPWDSTGHCNDYSCVDSLAVAWPGPGTGSTIVAAEDHPFEVNGRGALGDKLSFMGSANPPPEDVWVTPSVYDRLWSGLVPTGAPLQESALDVNLVRASGWIGSDDTLIVDPWYQLVGPAPEPASGTYTIEALDDVGQVLAGQGFDVSFVALGNPPVDQDPARFEATLPYPSGTDSFRVRRDSIVLGTVPISEHRPMVVLTTPSAGQAVSGPFTIKWQSDDVDGDVLLHTVEYSPDGQNWLVLTGGITETLFTADFDLLGGGDTAQLRVIVSDGVNTAESSAVTFVVPAKSPKAYIHSPAPGSVFRLGATVTLHGSAFDPQDGWLHSDPSLAWTSDRDGSLGSGELLNLTGLSSGWHMITLTATNSMALTGSAEVRVFISYSVYLPLVIRSH